MLENTMLWALYQNMYNGLRENDPASWCCMALVGGVFAMIIVMQGLTRVET